MLLVVLDNWYKTETETDPSGQLGSIFEGTIEWFILRWTESTDSGHIHSVIVCSVQTVM